MSNVQPIVPRFRHETSLAGAAGIGGKLSVSTALGKEPDKKSVALDRPTDLRLAPRDRPTRRPICATVPRFKMP